MSVVPERPPFRAREGEGENWARATPRVQANVRTPVGPALQGLLGEFLDRLSERHDRGAPHDTTGLPTGFQELDRLTAGMHRGDLIVVAGRPSIGKSAFALTIAQHVSVMLGLPTIIFSLEMDQQQLVDRLVSAVGRIDLQRLRTAKLSDNEWERVCEASELLSRAPLVIDDTSTLSIADLAARARKHATAVGGLRLVVVDYVQLMSGGPGASMDTRAAQVGDISRGLKLLARDLSCSVIALSQLSRSLASRGDKRPILRDLRDSGSLEDDADVIAFVYRDDYYTQVASKCPGLAEIIVGKQRNGPTGTVKLVFQRPIARFEDLAPDCDY